MNIFLTALNQAVPHFKIREGLLLLSQGHPWNRTRIELNKVAAHRLPSPLRLQIRLFRSKWIDFSLDGFRPEEVIRLRRALLEWERKNHQCPINAAPAPL
jgi:hypothetical protein